MRAAVLNEVHARPFTAVETPCRLLHFAFQTGPEAAQADRAALAEFCDERGLEPLKPGAKHHRLSLSGAILRWEQHSEFTTYTWELPADGQTPFQPAATALAAPLAGLPQPGPVLVALDLHAMAGDERDRHRAGVRPRQRGGGGEQRRRRACSPPISRSIPAASCACW